MAAPVLHSLKALLNRGGSRLQQLHAESQQLIQLRDTVRRQLPETLVPHCLGANLQTGTLVIYMDSAATATPVRYLQRDLLNKFAAAGLHCSSVKVQVLPYPPVPPNPEAPPRSLSDTARQVLESTATHLAEGPLKNSLQRLARHRKPRHKT